MELLGEILQQKVVLVLDQMLYMAKMVLVQDYGLPLVQELQQARTEQIGLLFLHIQMLDFQQANLVA